MASQAERGIRYPDIPNGEDGHLCLLFPCPNIENSRLELESVLQDFRQKHNLRAIVGILGGTDESGDLQKQIVSEFLSELENFKIGILSGGTIRGLPEIAINEARARNLPTIGVFPNEKEKKALINKLDLAIKTPVPLVGDGGFGTETPTLIRIPDVVLVIGGGTGTLIEVASILKRNKSLISDNKNPVWIIPVTGSGGVADIIYDLPGVKDVRNTLPPIYINNGIEAAIFLKSGIV